MSQIIGLTGLAGAGKSTVAHMLIAQHKFKLVKFADPLKDMLKAIGLGPDELEGSRKGLPCRLLGGKSPRYAMQTLGTEWGRTTIHDDLWVNIWKARARQHLLDGFGVACDDCRFENEARVIQDLGGQIWEIRRPGSGLTAGGTHPSEAGIAARFANARIMNSGTIEKLYLDVAGLL